MDFLQELVKQNLITAESIQSILSQAQEKYNGNIFVALHEMGLVDAKEILRVKSDFFALPTATVDDTTSSDPAIVRLIPQETISHYQMIPLGLENGVLQVGLVNPASTEAIDALQFISSKSGTPFKMFVIGYEDYLKVVKKQEGISSEVTDALDEFKTDDTLLVQTTGQNTESDIIDITASNAQLTGKKNTDTGKTNLVEDAPVIKIVAVTLRHAVEGNASDIHIENTGSEVRVRFRVDGTLHTSLKLPLNVYSSVVARVKILAKLRLDEKRKPQDGGFSVKISGRKIDFRVSTFPAYHGEKVVLRILDQERGVKKLSDLNLRPDHLEMVKNAISLPYGLIVISGPTGSGKSTTLYAMLNELDKEGKNVVSLENPVEYQMEGVTQSQVMPEIGYTFAAGLRSVLRQDPDVLMVGEIRDVETAQLAIQAALTGHLVLTTLHTNSSIGIVPRLIDMGVDPYLIAPTLRLAIAQRLARKTCEDAKQTQPMNESVRYMIVEQFKDFPEDKKSELGIGSDVVATVPTQTCPDGTKGRLAIFEMFEVSKDVERIILQNPTEQDMYQHLRKQGMITMKEDALLKSVKGEIPLSEVYNF